MGQDGDQTRKFFSARLKTVRKAAGYKSARALAKVLGIDENRYTRYERAEVEPNLQLIVRICDLLETSPNELLGFTRGASHRGSASATFAPGFSEPETPDLRYTTNDNQRRNLAADAAYWRLAQFLVDLDPRFRADDRGTPLQSIERVSRHYQEIQADPFGFAASIVKDPIVVAAGDDERRALAELLAHAIEATVGTTAPNA